MLIIKIVDGLLAIVGSILLIGSIVKILGYVRKKDYGKSFSEAIKYLIIGLILVLAWINSIF